MEETVIINGSRWSARFGSSLAGTIWMESTEGEGSTFTFTLSLDRG